MKQLTKTNELIGKTIKRNAYLENKLFFFFTDDTFCIVKGCGWEEWDVELSSDEFNTEPSDYYLDDLKEIGLLEEEKYLQLKAELNKREKESEKKHELDKLAELKKKYPND